MVRFKNRYLLVSMEGPLNNEFTDRDLVHVSQISQNTN